MGPYSMNTFSQLQDYLMVNCTSLPNGFINFLENLMYQSELQNEVSKPMVWIGIYIAVASIFCILPMVADLLHGLINKKLWFPCKYFTMNAASLTFIAIAMKLPVDLSNIMPYEVDQAAKLGSMSFMCTMMANLLPSLATVDSKELLTNILALGVLVITLVVNVCIQIQTGVVSNTTTYDFHGDYTGFITYKNWLIAFYYVAMLLMLLIIYACSVLVILKSKQILESKYKAGHETALKELELQQPTVDRLTSHVRNHWIMAETGSPQFMTVCSATTSASGVICVLSTFLHVVVMLYTRPHMKSYGSDYEWSIVAILLTQFTGVILGTIAPLSRCFASLSFKMSITWIWNHIRVFKVESYCTQKLSDWKHNSIPLRFCSRICKIVIQDLMVVIWSFCIGIQKMIVVACKMITLIPNLFVIGILCCIHCWKWLKVMFGALKTTTQVEQNKDLSMYVLQLQDDMELAEGILTRISKSMTCLIQTAKRQQPKNLMKLFEESSSFEGVGMYDMHQVPPLPDVKYVDCWSLTVVTLTAIAISLPKIRKNMVDGLLKSVSEGLLYVKHVEETLNTSDEYVIIQKVARMLWLEVNVYHKWLGNKLPNTVHKVKATIEIVQWFSDTANNMVTEVESNNMNGSYDQSSLNKSISANSMYRISQTILASYQANTDQVVSQDELFIHLSSMISHILAACLTNLPQVIVMKCHNSVIEKRETSVYATAQLLGETMQIINSLQKRELPSLEPDDLPVIDKWRDCFLQPFS